MVVLGGILVLHETHALTCPPLSRGDRVIVQNIGRRDDAGKGLNVRKRPHTRHNEIDRGL